MLEKLPHDNGEPVLLEKYPHTVVQIIIIKNIVLNVSEVEDDITEKAANECAVSCGTAPSVV